MPSTPSEQGLDSDNEHSHSELTQVTLSAARLDEAGACRIPAPSPVAPAATPQNDHEELEGSLRRYLEERLQLFFNRQMTQSMVLGAKVMHAEDVARRAQTKASEAEAKAEQALKESRETKALLEALLAERGLEQGHQSPKPATETRSEQRHQLPELRAAISPDIRDHYDVFGRDAAAVASLLESLSIMDGLKPRGPTGLNCLIMMLQRIYSHAMLGPDGLAKKDWFKVAEDNNPILSHAWHMFGQTRKARRTAGEARRELFESLVNTVDLANASFNELCRSELMNRTFWSQDDFRLYQPLYNMTTHKVDDLDRGKLAEASLLHLDRMNDPKLTLQNVADNAFGIFRTDGARRMFKPHKPVVVRVLYSPEKDPRHRLSVDSLHRFQLPYWRWCESSDGTGLYDTSGRNDYALIAVVRERLDEKDHDGIRTCALGGTIMSPRYDPTPGLWSLEDTIPRTYMLFFGLRADVALNETFSDISGTELRHLQAVQPTSASAQQLPETQVAQAKVPPNEGEQTPRQEIPAPGPKTPPMQSPQEELILYDATPPRPLYRNRRLSSSQHRRDTDNDESRTGNHGKGNRGHGKDRRKDGGRRRSGSP
ncbi:hypothetical protein FALBO_610 [Fusarium albosuccineum]|uniref:Uncharacterized protein n=1 Tax=Fusarium albosuccineum TaxID=1237068 RepID=A0A8H4PGZ8_9HYPO|nr:hypothetical protein FALBO_610 [Fusarium albosuccineum]